MSNKALSTLIINSFNSYILCNRYSHFADEATKTEKGQLHSLSLSDKIIIQL